MPLFHIILVAILQGLTEFLPVSSSGHLILLPKLTGLQDQGQAIDIAVHVGTLGAVLIYFRRDFSAVLRGIPALFAGNITHPGARLGLLLILATVPLVIFGALLKFSGLDAHLRSVALIGWTMLIFGVLLFWADQRGPTLNSAESWNRRDALRMGIAQALALIPGTSRSGITITAARAMGYRRQDSARLAMLMSVPAILVSGGYLLWETSTGMHPGFLRDGAIAAGLAFIAALFALSIMMRLLRSVSYTPYVIYRIALGLILLGIAYT
ncbi:MAG: undecaprenyl-diphosphate phosphatase [Rhodobacteraceae bacterium]|nr:undecaprenyl-diphosphate phosphatase [Paracoccaceae bacterium]